jgi:aryl carrier-like protein
MADRPRQMPGTGRPEGDEQVAAQVTVLSILSDLRGDLSRILYCDEEDIADDVTLVEQGLDSILGLELLAAFNARLQLRENIDAIYDHPTPAQLSEYLLGRVTAKAANS